MPIEQVHARLCPLIGDYRLANYDLTMAFAGLSRTPYVRTLRRSYRRPGRPRINNPRLWAVWFKLSGSLVIYRVRSARPPAHGLIRTFNGYHFYAWLPDLAEAWPTIFAPAPPPPLRVEGYSNVSASSTSPVPPIRVELVGKSKVQLVSEKPTLRGKAQSPSQLTEDQIQRLMGDVSELTDTEKKIRRYAVKKHRERWRSIDPAAIMKAAKGDKVYEEEVGVVVYSISTFRRALGRKE